MKEPVLILTYYWPPAGGPGVQRWMYFSKYLPENGFDPYVVTVDEKKASYKYIDHSFEQHVQNVPATRTNTREWIRLYSKVTTGKADQGIPNAFAGEAKPGMFKKMMRYVRGNFFIPDARKGWNRYAFKAAEELIKKHKIKKIVTTGPPHSTHLVGLKLKEKYKISWLADFRDPWTELYYNKFFYRSKRSDEKDRQYEKKVLQACDVALTVGPSMRNMLAAKIPGMEQKAKYILNGYDDDLFRGIDAVPPTDVFVVSHIGILGETQRVDAFLEALNELKQSGKLSPEKIVFKITGKVSPSIRERISELSPWLRVVYSDYVPHREAIIQMKASHLLLNSLADLEDSKYLITGKLMEYLGSGNAVMVLGDPEGDAAWLVNKYQWCGVYSRQDHAGITTALEKMYSEWAQGHSLVREIQDLPFSRRKTTAALAEVLQEL